MRLTLMKRVPTWDLLQKKNKHGPRICNLCKNKDENLSHLFSPYPFAIQFWKDVSQWLGVNNASHGGTVEEGLVPKPGF